jgi:cell wall-associated NlpC family hydrolase
MAAIDTPALDKRVHAYRPDLAAAALEGKVVADRFVAGHAAQVVRGSVALRGAPTMAEGLLTEALFGERLTILDEGGGWSWVQLARDSYVGYVPSDALRSEIRETTHRVKAIGTFLYPEPSIKSSPLMHLPLNAELEIEELGERFARVAGIGYVVARHVAEKHRMALDFVDIAERFIGTPYLWGGRTRIGLDCSGLLQLALEAAGHACPRDSDMQQAALGETVLIPADLEGLRRGDLIFWPGHVAMMTDGMMLLHANAHHMSVVAEPLAEAKQRIARAGSEIVAIKRLPSLSARVAA